MMRDEWLAIATRCERATGPDREIALAVARIFNVVVMRRNDDDTANEEHTYWDITASLDAITALIERELPGAAWRAVKPLDDRNPQGTIQRRAAQFFDVWVDTEAATPALALCAAFCRAMAEKALSRNSPETA